MIKGKQSMASEVKHKQAKVLMLPYLHTLSIISCTDLSLFTMPLPEEVTEADALSPMAMMVTDHDPRHDRHFHRNE
ncbi:hypothetical protein Krac_6268 [Ktedonobacter racemifer DSM 44963]|uniref:Uncharacterized protein n=1 Tax=Ktedonobacter racemifer DSM 44963 TaxID=485913 RepID=D6TYN6_KTERA|nr:hypothetical protein Krac_6268 [Ktedonobacter racemifer DSM 44963]